MASDLFGGVAVPRWQSGEESRMLATQQGMAAAEPFNRAFQNAFNKGWDEGVREKEDKKTKEALAPIADAMRGVQPGQQSPQQKSLQEKLDEATRQRDKALGGDVSGWVQPIGTTPVTPPPSSEPMIVQPQEPPQPSGPPRTSADFIDLINKHPEWMLNPRTAPYVQGMMGNWLKADQMKAQGEWYKARAAEVQGKLRDTAGFNRDLDALGDPVLRAKIRQMRRNPDGTPTADQIQALADGQQAEIAKRQAEIQAKIDEAKKAGASETLTIGPKGTTSKFVVPSAGKEGEPLTKSLPDGTTLAWMPGAKTLHVVRSGKSVELTPGQAEKLSEMTSLSDKDRSFFEQYAVAKGKEMTRGFKPKKEEPELKTPDKKGILDRIKEWFTGPSESPAQSKPAPAPVPEQKPAPIQAQGRKQLTPDVAREFLNLFNGDRAKAEAEARAAGYEW